MKLKSSVRWNTLKSLLVKEFKQLSRDKRMILVLFASPVILMFIFGYAIDTDVKLVKMSVLDQDKTSESRKFIQRFTASPYFEYYKSLESDTQISELLDKGKADIVIRIAPGFSKRVKSGRQTEVQIILDGTDSSRASVILSYVTQITNEFSMEFFSDKIKMLVLSRDTGGIRFQETLGVEERALFNPELISRNFFLPGILAILIMLITNMLTSMSIVKEKEAGTIEQIIVSPLRSVEYILGKTLPFAIVGFFDLCIVSLIAIIWFGVPFRGSFLFLLLCGLIYILSALSIGLYVSTISRTQQEAMLTTFLFFMPAILFSGFVFPVYSMPEVIQNIAYLNPMMYFITITRGIFLKGVGITVLWPDIAALIVIGAILLTLSVRRFARRID
jgi:ABC-2 type transport system permease protein